MNRKGMTLIEVLMVVILISIIAAIVIPRFSGGTKRAKVQSCEMNRSVINTSVEVYYVTEGTWPIVDLRNIKTNQSYFPDGIPTCPVDQTSYVLETTRFRVSGHREGAQSHIW
ncbi:MAG: type II secretion system protein [Ignavibacteriae bacterium]|nr:type II secretion system protein [Ignavibacteriota bacterium]